MSDQMVPITVAYGDGIGPEIMAATLEILKKARARIAPEVIEIGERVYLRGMLARLAGAGLGFIKTENLCSFDGQKAFSGAD